MKKQHLNSPATAAAALEARYALRVAAVLDEGAAALPADVVTRLRFARETALQRAQSTAAIAPAVAGRGAGVLTAGGGPRQWWLRLATALPLVALVGGLGLIQHLHSSSQIEAAADVDAALLSDEVPPSAYSDPAFVEFLKSPRE